MHRSLATAAIILIALGLVWIGQGTGLLKGSSFMVGDALWAWIGGACVVIGIALGAREVRRRRA
ncbi:MAG TPA: hypothetical protein VHS36_05620 [Candidatus Limnocylindrales bacterium]|jgi:hypothetical protein|nr:hypothetical protein [Candidatus Limnocylindrales bacterium]